MNKTFVKNSLMLLKYSLEMTNSVFPMFQTQFLFDFSAASRCSETLVFAKHWDFQSKDVASVYVQERPWLAPLSYKNKESKFVMFLYNIFCIFITSISALSWKMCNWLCRGQKISCSGNVNVYLQICYKIF
jgi:hypothetical protein